MRQAASGPQPARCGLIRDGHRIGTGIAAGLGVHLVLSVRHHCKAAFQFAARPAGPPRGSSSATAAVLARQVLRSMLLSKMAFLGISLVFLGAIAAGAGFVGQPPGRQAGKRELQDRRAGEPGLPQIAAPPSDAGTKPALGRRFVVGRVLDPNGKPVPNAAVMAYAVLKQTGRPHMAAASWSSAVTGQAQCDESGRFRIDAACTSSARHELAGVVAIAPGHGIRWSELDPDAEQPTTDITLQPEQVIHGRLFDLQGRPARGVHVKVWSIILRPLDATTLSSFLRFELTSAGGLSAWPKPATSDADGRFTLHGLGRGLWVDLVVDDPRYAYQEIAIGAEGTVDTPRYGPGNTVIKLDGNSESTPATIALQPARILTGRVTYADTARPVAGAMIETNTRAYAAQIRTDSQGRFRANLATTDQLIVTVYPPEGQPYLMKSQLFNWPKGAVEQSLDLGLSRGVMIRGQVTEAGSGAPVSGAVLRFRSHQLSLIDRSSSPPSTTKQDGSFQFAFEPKPGYLSIQGSSDDYALREASQRLLDEAKPSGRRLYAHGYVFLDVKAGSESQDVHVTLQRGATVKGQVNGPDGQPVRDAWIFSRTIARSPVGGWKMWSGRDRDSVYNGFFELHGLDPDIDVPVFFLDPKHTLGATVKFSGRLAADSPVTVRLEPCGSAKMRLVDLRGKPVAGFKLGPFCTRMVITPGALSRAREQQSDQVWADEDRLTVIDPINYTAPPISGADGGIILPALVPGATYRFVDRTTFREPKGPQLRKEFSVKPGETLDLGDILIEKSQQ